MSWVEFPNFFDTHFKCSWLAIYILSCFSEIIIHLFLEVEKGAETIVIDNTNLCEWEYIRFVQKAQQEHYFVSIVTLPPPEVSIATKRSALDVNDDQFV